MEYPNPTNIATDWLKTYAPWTNWGGAFSRNFYFGCNIKDAPTEAHVLNTVGSYGFQLNRIIDMVQLIDKYAKVDLKNADLSSSERQKLRDFRELAEAADLAAKEYKGENQR